MEKISLSPPWETLSKEFVHTFGKSPLVTVKKLHPSNQNNKTLFIEIIVKDDNMAFSLRQIIKPIFNFGKITVQTIVKNSIGTTEKILDRSYTAQEVADLFCISLKSNPLFKGVIIQDNEIFVILKKSIIQFFNDDVSDFYGNYNQIASIVFKDLSTNKFKNNNASLHYLIVKFSTYYNKAIHKNIKNIIDEDKFYCSKT